MSDLEATADDGLTTDEKAYFETRGGETGDPPAADPPKEEAKGATGDEAAKAGDAADAAQGDAEKGKTGTVPHGALHAEREKRKGIEAELQKLRTESAATTARMDERLRILQGLQQAQQKPADQQRVEIPDPDAEPVAFMKVLGQAVGVMAQERQQTEERRVQQQRETAEREQVSGLYHQGMQEQLKETPDFADAYAHLGRSRATELWRQMGEPTITPQVQKMLTDRLHSEELAMAKMAISRGINPARLVYNFALDRGYQPKAKEDAAAAPDPAKKLEEVAAAQTANKTLSNSGGGGGLTGEMTAAKLASLSDKDFDAWIVKNPGGFQRLAGG